MYTYIHFIVQQKLAQHCKATIPQLKKTKEIQIKVTMRYHFISVRMVIIKKLMANAGEDEKNQNSCSLFLGL